MLNLFLLVALMSVAVYRATRFVILDSLIDQQRIWFHTWLLGVKPGAVRAKLFDLVTCAYCLTVWFSAVTVLITDQFSVVPLPWLAWVATCGGAVIVWQWAEG